MITHLWVPAFLAELERTGIISHAARVASVNRTTVYFHRNHDEEFKAQWDDALEVATESLELEARRRALEGAERPVFYRGEEVGKTREYSDVLMMFLLKGLRPLKYRDNVDVGLSGGVNIVDLVGEAEKRADDRRRQRETDEASE